MSTGTNETVSVPRPGLTQFQDEAFLASFFQDPILGRIMMQLIKMNIGEAIPSERALSQQLGISRTALRDRISRLSSMGIITKKPRENTVFSGVNHGSLGDFFLMGLLGSNFDIYTLIDMRKSIEVHAVVRLTSADARPDLTEVEAAVDGISKLTGEELEQADQAFHLGLLKAAGLGGLAFFWHGLDQIFENTHNNLDYGQDLELFRFKHRRIFETVRDRDLPLAIEAVDEHFNWLIELLERKGF